MTLEADWTKSEERSEANAGAQWTEDDVTRQISELVTDDAHRYQDSA